MLQTYRQNGKPFLKLKISQRALNFFLYTIIHRLDRQNQNIGKNLTLTRLMLSSFFFVELPSNRNQEERTLSARQLGRRRRRRAVRRHLLAKNSANFCLDEEKDIEKAKEYLRYTFLSILKW